MKSGKKRMVFTTISVTSWYIYKEVKKRKAMSTAMKEKEIMIEEFKREFNEKYRRASNINKLRTKKKLKEMFNIKSKNKQ